jgi:hypothetical protein
VKLLDCSVTTAAITTCDDLEVRVCWHQRATWSLLGGLGMVVVRQ